VEPAELSDIAENCEVFRILPELLLPRDPRERKSGMILTEINESTIGYVATVRVGSFATGKNSNFWASFPAPPSTCNQ